MNNLKEYIIEKLKLNKNIKPVDHHQYHPKTNEELLDLCDKLIRERRPYPDLNDIDVSEIDNFDSIFNGLDCEGINITDWDVSNAKSMECMFSWSERFDSDLSKWDVSNVTNMKGMFYHASGFPGRGLEKWNVSDKCNMREMFEECDDLKNKPSWYHE